MTAADVSGQSVFSLVFGSAHAFLLLILLRSSTGEESRLTSGTSAPSQESPDKETAEFDWNQVLQINPSSLQNWKKDELQEIFNTFVQVTSSHHSDY